MRTDCPKAAPDLLMSSVDRCPPRPPSVVFGGTNQLCAVYHGCNLLSVFALEVSAAVCVRPLLDAPSFA